MTAQASGRFPDFDEDFKYAEIADDSLRNQLIEETVAARMDAFCGALVHTATVNCRGWVRRTALRGCIGFPAISKPLSAWISPRRVPFIPSSG